MEKKNKVGIVLRNVYQSGWEQSNCTFRTVEIENQEISDLIEKGYSIVGGEDKEAKK